MTEREWTEHVERAARLLSYKLGQVEWADGLLKTRDSSRFDLNWPYIEKSRTEALSEIPDLRARLFDMLGKCPAEFAAALALDDDDAGARS